MASNSGDPEATSPVSDHEEVQPTVPDMDKYIVPGGSGGENESGGQQKVVAKLLVSNSAAGSVIGKNGVSIDQLQRSSKARIQLSRAGEFYPGTSDRVLMLSGPLHNVLTALYLILEKVANDNTHRLQNDNNTEQIKVALPRRLCGVVIGQQGSTVRNFMTDSGATIRVQSLNDLSREDSERIVTIYGSRDKVLRAAALVLNALSMDPKYAGYLETTLQLAQSQGLVGPVKTTVGKSPLFGARTTIIVAIPDEDVGAILGKGGQTLARLQQAAKVKISVSDRKMMDPKEREREVTIVGTHPQVKHAEAMIAEKISQHRAQRAAAEDDEYDGEEHH